MAGKLTPRRKKYINKKLIIQALTDPTFRKKLKTDPKAALGKPKLLPHHKQEIKFVLAVVKGIEGQISSLADQLLCNNNGDPCGIS